MDVLGLVFSLLALCTAVPIGRTIYDLYIQDRYYAGWQVWHAQELLSGDPERIQKAFDEVMALNPANCSSKELTRAYKRRWKEVRERNRLEDSATS